MSFRTLTLLLAVAAVVLCTFVQTAEALNAAAVKSIVKAHNKVRSKHHSPDIKWSKTLASYAQKWSDGCQFKHSGGKYGENLAVGYPDWESVVDGWYSEVKNYNYDNPGFSMDTGHFTQVVWKDTTEVGCGVTSCDNLGNGAKLYTCSYKDPGNMVASGNVYFIKNVQKP